MGIVGETGNTVSGRSGFCPLLYSPNFAHGRMRCPAPAVADGAAFAVRLVNCRRGLHGSFPFETEPSRDSFKNFHPAARGHGFAGDQKVLYEGAFGGRFRRVGGGERAGLFRVRAVTVRVSGREEINYSFFIKRGGQTARGQIAFAISNPSRFVT